MIRFIASSVLALLANTLGLFAASVLLNGFSINGISFIVAAIIFTLATVILGPLIVKTAATSAPYLLGGISLITILACLIVTDIFSDGLSITGLSTWVLATLIIWVFSVIANVLLPLVIFKNVLKKEKEAN